MAHGSPRMRRTNLYLLRNLHLLRGCLSRLSNILQGTSVQNVITRALKYIMGLHAAHVRGYSAVRVLMYEVKLGLRF
jgi:hypothetical protein